MLQPVALGSSGPAPARFSCTSFTAPGKLMHRRSSRLAAKHKGARKSSLFQAQDLMCRKHKLVRFAAKAARSSSSSSLPPAALDEPRALLLLPGSGASSAAPRSDPGTKGGPSERRDFQVPLSMEEICSIQVACEIPAEGGEELGPPAELGVGPPRSEGGA